MAVHRPVRHRVTLLTILAVAVLSVPLATMSVAAAGAKRPSTCHGQKCPDTTAPSVTISSPASGTTITATTAVTGTASDNRSVAGLAVEVDKGPGQAASGTTSWSYSLDPTGLSIGQHVITAVATDGAGNVGTVSIALNVSSGPLPGPSPSPSPSPTPSPSPSLSPSSSPPPPGGYFALVPAGQWASLPNADACKSLEHYSTWEPRPDNYKRNHVVPNAQAVHDSLAARPRAVSGTYDSRWDSWLLARVDGQFTGTTDEIFQWAACKWGLPDDLLRAIAVRESTWYQYETYPSGRCVTHYSCGDFFSSVTTSSKVYCDGLAKYGYDYQQDYGSGLCPKTFSIVGVMDWDDPAWEAPAPPFPDNQNGTFPFNRNSTAFAVDYLGSQLRGCFEGWEFWLKDTGTESYAGGDLWGCVGAWYSGDWHSSLADGYISRVQNEMVTFPWLDPTWPTNKPGCTVYGCPAPDPL
jgi:Big-like domain-containing protein